MLRDHNAHKMINRLYTLFLALLMALFVGVGIAAFYHAPKTPDTPIFKTAPAPESTPSSDIERQERDYQVQQDAYQKEYKTYNRNVSLLALAGAIVLVTLGLTALKAVTLINDSLLLGGIFTLVYSIMRGFGASDDTFRFVLVSSSMAIALLLGYLRLIKPAQTPHRK
jgi:hypothetical protein